MGDYVTVEGHKIYYVKKGHKGEPIILLHGLPMNSFLWRKVQDRLADNFQAYALDMLGYGKSDKPEDADYTWTGQAKRVVGFMDALGIQKATITGHDHGGGVSLIVACNYPDRVSKLIFANGCGYDYCLPPTVRLIGALGNLPEEQLAFARPFAVAFFSMGLMLLVYNRNRLTTDIMPHYMSPWETPEGFKALTKHCSMPSNEEILALDLSRIKIPTLIVWGLEDAGLPLETAYRLRKDIGGPVQIKTIPKAGHFLQEDEPEILADYMTEFLFASASIPL